MKNRPELGFKWENGCATFSCTKCPAEVAIRKTSGHMSAEAAAVFARNKGWVASPINNRLTLCPACHRKPKAKNDTDSELRRASTRPTEETMSASAEKPDPRPTADQRVRIRSLLDKHFDDSVGRYLDGMSDQKIAESLKIPRLIVERIREAAYGPIGPDPDVARVRKELESIDGEHKKLAERLDKCWKAMGALEYGDILK